MAAQAFHTLYHTDENALLGAPTGSGKTISAELAMLRVFRNSPGGKVVYIAPLKVRIQVMRGGLGPCCGCSGTARAARSSASPL